MILPDKTDVSFVAKNNYGNGKIVILIDGQENYTLKNSSIVNNLLYKTPLKLIKIAENHTLTL
jgi:hypothetical protein